MSISRIGEPRRHLTGKDCGLDRFRPRLGFSISENRHWSDFARTMTALTVLLEDGQNIFVECYRRRFFHGGAHGNGERRHPDEQTSKCPSIPNHIQPPGNGSAFSAYLTSFWRD